MQRSWNLEAKIHTCIYILLLSFPGLTVSFHNRDFLDFTWSERSFQERSQAAREPGVRGLCDGRDPTCVERHTFYSSHLPSWAVIYIVPALSAFSYRRDAPALPSSLWSFIQCLLTRHYNILCHCLRDILMMVKASPRSSFDSSAIPVVM